MEGAFPQFFIEYNHVTRKNIHKYNSVPETKSLNQQNEVPIYQNEQVEWVTLLLTLNG